jgi:outer membrane protein OmpA-like peptidoglycan-associated protein
MKLKGLFVAGLISLTTTLGAQTKPQSPKVDNNPQKSAIAEEPRELSPAVNIFFDINESEITTKEQKKLESLINTLKGIKEYRLVLTGHTDSTGNDVYNMELSRDRVDEVFDALISLGINEKWMMPKYFGRSKPRVGETNKEKAAQNRRVEITIIEKPKEEPKVEPVKPDPCVGDTTIMLNGQLEMTINKCDLKKLQDQAKAKGKSGDLGIKVSKISDIMGIIQSDMPLVYKQKEGMEWVGIIDVKFAVDSCLEHPVTITIDPMDFEGYRKSRVKVLAKSLKTGNMDNSKDRNKKIRKRTIKKDAVKFDVTLNCPTSKDAEGKIVLAAPAGASKVVEIKDKTKQIETVYIVQESPITIIQSQMVDNKMYINYKKLENPQFIFKLTDGTYTEMIPVNSVKKISKKLQAAKALGKKYKIKGKHLRD